MRYLFLLLIASVFVTSASLPSRAEAEQGWNPGKWLLSDADCNDLHPLPEIEIDGLSEIEKLAVAVAYDFGVCVEQDYGKAYDIYLPLAKHGDETAWARLGYFYQNGLGVDRNEERARYWFRSIALCSGFDIPEPEDPARFFFERYFTDRKFPALLAEEIRRAKVEEKGPADILMRNYRDLMSGNGVYRQPTCARGWLSNLARTGHGEAWYLMARMDFDAGATEKERHRYLGNLHMAASHNYPPAQRELGEIYLRGELKPRYLYRALIWLYRAQRNGLNVEALIREAEDLAEPGDAKAAAKRAADFDFDQ